MEYTHVAIHSFLLAETKISWYSPSLVFPFEFPSPPRRWTCGTGLELFVTSVQRIVASLS